MNSLKTLLTVGLVALPFQALSMDEPSGCDAGEKELKFSIVTSVHGHTKGEAALALAASLNEQLDGEYCMKVYGSSELYPDDQTLFDAMQRGEIHFAAPSLSKLLSMSEKFALFDLPFLFDGPLHALEFINSDAAFGILGDLEDDGFKGLSFWTNGMRHFSATVPMRAPTDASGMTFRVQSSSEITLAMLDRMEVEGQRLAFKDVYDNLANGTVQGQQNTWSNIETKSFYTVQAATTETSHTYLGYAVIVTQDFLDGLDAETRQIITDTVSLVTHERNRFAFELNQMSRQNILEDEGIILTLNDAERQAWRDAFAPIIAQFKPQIGAELVDEAIRINAETRPFD
ncbi:MAG: TRAP transporter substrate-binding protein DctP [Pseudomonadota bacterium]